MRNIDKLFKIERLHKLIKLQFRGTSDDYAEKLKISRSSLYNYIEDLKCVGAEITYCRLTGCYKYENNFEFEIKVKINSLTCDEMNKVCGGSNFYSSVHFFWTESKYFCN